MVVRVAVLGPVRAEVAGVPVDLGGPRQRAVLARLAVAGGEVVSTDLLVDDLWRGEPPPRALGALQVHVSHLRRVLEPGRRPRTPASVLVSEAPGYALRLPADSLDSRRVGALLDAAALAPPDRAEELLVEALRSWSGPAFAEFADERWAAPEAARLGELRLVATERLAEARLARGRAADVVPDLEVLLRDHPLRENAVRLLALALYRTGRQADALAVLARARTRLAEELGVDPGPELRALERDVLTQAEHVRPALRPVAAEPGPAIVGRTAELHRLRSAAERARSGVAVVLVEADAGGGKSALVEAFRAGLPGWTTALGRCPEVDGAPPGWAWTELVEELARAVPVSEDLAARLAPLRAAGPGREEVGETFWLSRAVVELVGGVAAGGPVLLVLDDLHRAEDETLQLLRAVVGGLGAAPVLVVATLRPAEVGPDLAATLAALAGPVADRITLTGLTGPEVRALLTGQGVADPDEHTVALVTARTDGNPLFVRETARLIAVEGAAAAADTIPAGVRDVLRRRVARLPAPARTVLGQASVLGREVDIDTLVRLAAGSGGSEDGVLDALELGVLAGLLTEPAPGRVRFAHALVRDTLDADLPRLRRTRLHAAALAAVEAGPADPAALARHALEAGPAVPPATALRHVEAAAHEAAGFGAHRDAARLWAAAIALAGPAGVEVDHEIALRCGHVSALAHAGQVAAAVRARRAAVDRARGTAFLVAALTSYDAPVSWTIRQDIAVDADLVGLLDGALADPHVDPATRCRLLVALTFELETHDDDRVRELTAEAVALSAGLGDPLLRCRVLNARSFAALGPDLRHELEGVGRELLETAERAGLAGYRSEGHHLLFMLACERFDLDAAQSHADAAIAAASGGQLGVTLAWAAIFAALRAVVAGDFASAEQGYAAVQAAMESVGAINADNLALFGLFGVRHAQGRLAELAPAFAALQARIPDSVTDPTARALIAAGRIDEARAVWRPDLHPPRTYYWLLFMGLRAEVAVALGNRAAAAACLSELEPWADQLAGLASGTVTLGPVAQHLGELGGVLGRPVAERRAHFAHARAIARLLGSPHWEERAAAALTELER
ncbi:AAA family ATPase [Pseudonocardia sp. RS11V-5]|uniref:BTAD domain-containing putative transcriptional regulator n=1 Tax=Pseudonocardia terrae TaxID=2905831 RepID=UPI001E448C02|nr:BTAD domain-containing putative transcriptional regulator [Pseudonocardia terrae]MCE3550449.1 AAA family ATPase [Pseudonocardia terrae]